MNRIDIKVGYKCNNNCQFCVQGAKRYRCRDKTSRQIRSILKTSMGSYGEVIFTGGEATIRSDIIELVAFAKKRGYKVQIQSNGRMFSYIDFCRRIINAGADIFAISIHGHNARLHDSLTQAEGSFEQTSRGICNLLSLAQPTYTNTVINKINYKFLPEIAKFLINLGIFQYQFAYPHILGSASDNLEQIVPQKREIITYLKKGLDIGLRKKRNPRTEAIPYCLLKGYENCVAEEYMPETKLFGTELIESFGRWRREEGKAKGPRCKECKYFFRCEGPWREYPAIFGWDEFIPVK